jgi:outer membrane protein OmpA-like peptidoglycan-associated protein
MKLKLFLYFFWMPLSVFAQGNLLKDTLPSPIETKTAKPAEQVFTIAEGMPIFANGEKTLFTYLKENLRYPKQARINGTEGTVYLHCWVDNAGLFFDITVKRGVKDGCTEEAIRLLKTVPQGILVPTNIRIPKHSYILPVKFRLPDSTQHAFDTLPAAGEIVFLKNVFFERDTPILHPASYDELNDLINMLKKYSTLKIDIEGYCTDFQHVPTRSKLDYSKTTGDNSERSKVYSKTVYDYLTQNGIEPHRLNYVGYGKLSRIATDETPEGRAANRRVAIVIPLEPIEIIDYGKEKSVSNCAHSNCQIIANDSTNAQFPMGEKALFEYIRTHLKYPRFFYIGGIAGTVYLTFIVAKDGSVQHIEVRRGMSGGCTEAAVRVLKGMPKWIPATKNGQKVCSRWTLPIKFTFD